MLLVKIHLSEEDRLLVVQRLEFFGTRSRGYEAGAREVFGRSVAGLSDLELAEPVVISHWPRRYREPENADAVRSKEQVLLAACLSRS